MADEDLNEMSHEILPMERSAIHRISAGQGIFDLAGAVKELVENSLDAGANRIDIRLKDYGAHLIEVADNGPGVSPKNYQALTLKHYTSKISKFTDLKNLSSFGFRGEALSSLCALSRVTISTKTANESSGTKLEYDLSGILVTRSPIARCVGTTVAISKLFFPLPVRENEFNRNVKREFGRLVTVLQAYALISKKIRILCTNNVGKAGRRTVVQTFGSLSMRDNIVAVFGTKTIKCLHWIELSISDECHVEGFLSKPSRGHGRGSRDRQFFFINGRPVDMPKAAKVLNKLYRSFNPLQFPMVIINFVLPNSAYDINVSPDKRKVFVHSEGDLMKGLIAALLKDYAPAMDATKTTAEKKKKKKLVEPSSVQEAAGGDSCGGQGQCGEVEWEGIPVSAASDSAECGKHSFEDLEQGWDVEREESHRISTFDPAEYGKHSFGDLELGVEVEREEPSIISTSDTAGYAEDSCGGRGPDGNVDRDCVPILASSDLAEYGKQLLNVPDRFFLKLKPSRPSPRLKSRNAISSSDSLSAGPSRTSHSEVQSHTTVQHKLPKLVSTCKKPLEESGEGLSEDSGPLLEPCGLDNTSDLDKDASKFQRIQPKNVRQVSLSGWFNGSEKSSESYAHEGAMSSKLKLRSQRMRLRRNIEAETAELADVSPEDQFEVRRESSDETRTQQRAAELARLSSMHTARREGNTDALHDLEIGKHRQYPLATGPEGQTSSVLRLNRLSTAEVKKAGGRPKDVSFLKFDAERLQVLSKLGFLRNEKKERLMESRKKKSFTFATISDGCIAETPAEKSAALVAATKELQQKLEKTDFKRMKVVGQFDLRFILVSLDQDIFILDQHASDEIYNYELILKTSVLESQPLPKSVPLEVNASDQVVVETHLKTFRENGFDFRRKRQRSGGHKLHLSAVPSCTNDMLGVEDVKELIASLANRPSECHNFHTGHLHANYSCSSSSLPLRPSRLKAIFASQACQASRTVGDALSKEEMEEVVSRLGEVEAPWTCRHGLPTIRHVIDLGSSLKLCGPFSSSSTDGPGLEV